MFVHVMLLLSGAFFFEINDSGNFYEWSKDLNDPSVFFLLKINFLIIILQLTRIIFRADVIKKV